MMSQVFKFWRSGAALVAVQHRFIACPFRVALAGWMALLLALPSHVRAQEQGPPEGWSFDPQERYEAAHNAFEVQEYRLAIELWMDMLSHPKCSELGGDMVRTLGQNLVSAIEASFKRASIGEQGRQSAAYKKIYEDATRFCGVYEYFQEGETYSEAVEDTCLRWSEQEAPETPEPSQKATSATKTTTHTGPAVVTPHPNMTYPAGGSSRPPQLRAGLAMLVSAGVASAFGVVGMIAEGRSMRNYHTSIQNNATDPALRERADTWRTVAVVSGGVSLALVTVGAVLCLAGSRPRQFAAKRRKQRRTALRFRPDGLSLRF